MTLHTLLTVVAAAIALYLAFGVLYQFAYAVTGLLPQPRPAKRGGERELTRFAVFVAAYKEDGVIVETARRARRQRYPDDRYEVIVLADQLRPSTLRELAKIEGVRTVLVIEDVSTKSKALRAGLRAVAEDGFTGAVVLDADNHMAPDFLLEADAYLAAGFRAVQGRRTAPPGQLNSTAQWDAISEAVNNHILCAGHHAVGFSARLAGSGMAFDYGVFAAVMREVDAIGGFDKELELRLTRAGEAIAYAREAVVYDEKVASPEVFARQRGRWLAAQYLYASRFLPGAIVELLRRGNVDHANKALQMALPPRLLLPVSLLLLMTAALPWSTAWAAVFAGLFLLNAATFALAIPPSMWEGASWLLVQRLPGLVWQAGRAVVMMPASAKTFYHTPHAEVVTLPEESAHPANAPRGVGER